MVYFFIILFSLIFGSFLNVVIYRLPLLLQQNWQQQCQKFLGIAIEKFITFNLFTPGSHCPHCKAAIRFYQNIPILSFLALKGRCAVCSKRISWVYPLVEFSAVFSALLAYEHWGLEWKTVAAIIFCWSLIILFFIDLHHFLLPDEITFALLWLGLSCNAFHLFTDLKTALFGAVCGYLLLWLPGWLFKWLRKKEGIGNGDCKLLAACGAWLGWDKLPVLLFGATTLALFVALSLMFNKKLQVQSPIAFGPYLIIFAFIGLFCPMCLSL